MEQTQTHPETRQQLRVVVHAVLPREPEVVFDYLTHLENNPEWNWAVTSTWALTDGPPRHAAQSTPFGAVVDFGG